MIRYALVMIDPGSPRSGGKPRSDPRDISTESSLNQQVSARSNKRRRTFSLEELLPTITALLTAAAGALTAFEVAAKPINTLLVTLIIIGSVLAIAIVGMVTWIRLARNNRRKIYTSEADILDSNLRELISEIARGQIEFEDRMTSADKSAQLES